MPNKQKESVLGIIWPFRTIPQVKLALDGIFHGAFGEKWAKNDPFLQMLANKGKKRLANGRKRIFAHRIPLKHLPNFE